MKIDSYTHLRPLINFYDCEFVTFISMCKDIQLPLPIQKLSPPLPREDGRAAKKENEKGKGNPKQCVL